jgi:UDP-N-acetylglucosamine--N-acetylmuramyl-(pentapeptide) pyrophosphoryl-undecaprenol N-acetylglucosamine transferase
LAKKTKMNVAIACGGTGGHLFPGLAIAQQLRREGHRVLLLVSQKDIDQHAFDFGEQFPVRRIPAIGLPRRRVSVAMLGFLLRLAASVVKCQWLYMKYGTDVVLGMGGFTSAAAVIAGQLRFLPTVVHESNAIPGKANRSAARFARFVACGFQDCVSHFPAGKGVWTGTPVREQLVEMPREEARRRLSLDPQKPTLLVMGGSQGARAINEAVMGAWPRIKDFNVIHLTGEEDYQLAKDVYEGAGAPVCVRPFLREMDLAYNAADLAVSRAGAASLTEIAHYRLPAILVPYPLAAEDHQRLNAEIFERAGAAQIVGQDQLSPEQLALSVRTLWNNAGKRARMGQKVITLHRTDAAEQVIELLKKAARLEPATQPTEATA